MGKDKKQNELDEVIDETTSQYDDEPFYDGPVLEAGFTDLYNSDFKFCLIIDVLENLLTSNYEYKPVEKTGYENVSNKTLYNIFRYPKFKKFSKKKILNLFSEVNKRICKTLQISPSVFDEMTKEDAHNNNFENTNQNGASQGEGSVYFLSSLTTNKIAINFDCIKYLDYASLISCIFHETLHSYQMQQLDRMNKGKLDIDIDNLIANFQTTVITSHIGFNNEIKSQLESKKTESEIKAEKDAEKEIKILKKNATFKELRRLKKPYRERSMEYRLNNDYCFDLTELEANLFENRMMNKLYDNQIIPMKDNVRSDIDIETSADFVSTFTNHNINKEKHLLKKYLSLIKDNYKNYEKYLLGNDIEVLESFLKNVTPKAIDDYYDKKANELRSIKNLVYHEMDILGLGEYCDLPLNENL